MNEKIQSSGEYEFITGSPVLSKVNYPVIEIKDRMISVILDDIENNKIELSFQPYQALKITAQDCFARPQHSKYPFSQIVYQHNSAWIEQLRLALQVNDESANFMDKALHFTIPAGDDVLEIAAWKIEIKCPDKNITFPEAIILPPF